MRQLAGWMAALLLAGCDGMVSEMASDFDGGDDGRDGAISVTPSNDAGATDAGTESDGGGGDAGSRDAGTAEVDSGEPDAGTHDAGTHDAGMFVDAGTHDAGFIDAGPPDSRQTPYVIFSTDAGNGFYEYLPPGYGDGVPRPLMVFWHGIGENGVGDGGLQDLHLVLANGPPKLINNNTWSNALPFVVLSPQHRGGGCPDNTEISNFISWAIGHYDVDLKRLYLTGLSCGAIGSWQYVAANLDTVIAAAVLISGDPGDPTQSYSAWGHNMCNLGQLPIWSFHGDMDPTVNIADDENTMNLLIACPMPPRKDDIFTVYPGAGHDVWTRTYDLSAGHDIYTWLLQQSKP